MLVNGTHYRSIWLDEDQRVWIIDQTLLPHEFKLRELRSLDAAVEAIRTMRVRGAPLVGATAAWGIWLALKQESGDPALTDAVAALSQTRPTAVNLRTALEEMTTGLATIEHNARAGVAMRMAMDICERDVAVNKAIGRHGLDVLRRMAPDDRPLNILTHCNAGWLATVDWGTVTAPIYAAHAVGLPVHVWVDETRPRIQGALTAWELAHTGIPHTFITDNTGGHLMQQGEVDLCIVGTDRTTASGDVANKIGTYLKALAARDNEIPFYVALPSSTIDWGLHDGRKIPIEQRDSREVTTVRGRTDDDRDETVRIVPAKTPAANYGFDVTPARLVSGLITERGVAPATPEGLARMFPEEAENAGERRRHG